MEKKLVLLGGLRSQAMHGYQLNEMLNQSSGLAITLTKSNAYKLLKNMEQDGWIAAHQEQEGNRPPRRVYTVTPKGEAAFQQLLRESLATYPTPELPSAVALNYLDALPLEEATSLLRQRRQVVKEHFEQLEAFPSEIRESHLGVAYLHRFYANELSWLGELLARLQQGDSDFGTEGVATP
ncbi:MAG: PadR family transcriptional regulator [Chloroflexota bacterium]|nr:PadR family transcriptional regulator [Chloroflexota bacterium]